MIAPPVDFWPCPSPWQKTFPVHPSGKLSPCQGRDGSFPRRRDGRHLQGQKSGACSDAAPHSLSEKRRWADFFSTSFNTIEALRRGNWWDIRWENRPPNCQKMLTNLFISSNWHSIRQFERAWVEKTLCPISERSRGIHHKVRLSGKHTVIYDCKYDEKTIKTWIIRPNPRADCDLRADCGLI